MFTLHLSGNTYVPLGGQHVSCALWLLWKSYSLRGSAEARIPPNIRFVRAEVISHKAPLGVCRAAAGDHHRRQGNVRATTTNDAIRHFRLAVEAKVKGEGREQFLTDDELWLELKSLGVQLESHDQKKNPRSYGDQVSSFCFSRSEKYIMSSPFQKRLMLNNWRLVAWFAAGWMAMPEVLDVLQEVEAVRGEILTQAMIKEACVLTYSDVEHIGRWIKKQGVQATKKEMGELLKRMRVRRYALWSIMHPQNDAVHPDKSMFPLLLVSRNVLYRLF